MVSSRFQRLEIERVTPTASDVETLEVHDGAYWLTRASEKRAQGMFENALRDYSRAVEADRSRVAGWLGQVRMLIALEELPEAELWARKALELFLGNADLEAGRGQALCRMGQMKEAQTAADAAIRAAGDSVYPWLVRGDLMLARKQAVEEHCFSRAAQANGDWITQVEIAEIYFYRRRFAKALGHLQQAVERGAATRYAWELLRRCRAALGMEHRRDS